jgi:murein DD-endopeptidase MepM/ murein hydrolase activator NlpD
MGTNIQVNYQLATTNGVLLLLQHSQLDKVLSQGTVSYLSLATNGLAGSLPAMPQSGSSQFYALAQDTNAQLADYQTQPETDDPTPAELYFEAPGLPQPMPTNQSVAITAYAEMGEGTVQIVQGTLTLYLVDSNGYEVAFPYTLTPNVLAVTNGVAQGNIILQTAGDLMGTTIGVAWHPSSSGGQAVFLAGNKKQPNGPVPKPNALSGQVQTLNSKPALSAFQHPPLQWQHPVYSAANPFTTPPHIVGTFGEWPGHAAIHQGIDISTGQSRPIYAAADGVVVFAANTAISVVVYSVVVYHGYNLYTRYLHVTPAPNIYPKKIVQRGDWIATTGLNGQLGVGSDGAAHLHFEIVKKTGAEANYIIGQSLGLGNNLNPLLDPITGTQDAAFTPSLFGFDATPAKVTKMWICQGNPMDNFSSRQATNIQNPYLAFQIVDADGSSYLSPYYVSVIWPGTQQSMLFDQMPFNSLGQNINDYSPDNSSLCPGWADYSAADKADRTKRYRHAFSVPADVAQSAHWWSFDLVVASPVTSGLLVGGSPTTFIPAAVRTDTFEFGPELVGVTAVDVDGQSRPRFSAVVKTHCG